MTQSTRTSRAITRLATAILAGSLSVGLLGSTTPVAGAAVATYPTDAAMILYNVPPEDLLANRHGICNGAFNLVVRNVAGVAGARRYLDAAQACGLRAILSFSTTTNGAGRVYPSRVAALVNSVKTHPALFGYLSVKEPSWIGISRTEIRSLYAAYKKADPNHPVVALFGDIPHFGDTRNPYTAGMADVVMVDWYPVETSRGGCNSVGTSYITTGPKWYRKVRKAVALKTPGTPIWVMVQTHKYLKAGCHRKQRPSHALLDRQVREAFANAGAQGIAFQTFRNTNYNIDEHRDPTMVGWMKQISTQVRAGTY
jgi:hypothetical protein